MEKLEALIGLNLVEDIGSVRLERLLEYFGQPQDIFKATKDQLVSVLGISEKIASKILALKEEKIDKELSLAKKLGLKILTLADPDYPENLKNIYSPPIVLYIKGKLEPEDKFAVGIVGSRRASYYGLSNAESFAAELCVKGFTVVSGMARGIDTAAHRGALKQGGRTIAVIGSGFNCLYPEENIGLAKSIAENGAVISEFPINTQPMPFNFPRRNRLISGLSLGVLVVEAAKNSGALITADFALEQGREVFALPGKIDSNTSLGTNALIKQGAKLVSSVDEIVEEFISTISQVKQRDPKEELRPQGANEEEFLVLGHITQQSIQLDELLEKTKLDIPEVSGILLRLQLQRLVKELPGKRFVRQG